AFAGLTPTSSVLDIGCGCGRNAFALTHYLSAEDAYVGFDIVPALIEWGREDITPLCPEFHFQPADLFNSDYNPSCTDPPASHPSLLTTPETISPWRCPCPRPSAASTPSASSRRRIACCDAAAARFSRFSSSTTAPAP